MLALLVAVNHFDSVAHTASILAVFAALAVAQPAGRPLFNGRNLDGWMWSVDANPPVPSWAAVDGELQTTPGKGTHVYLLTKESFTDFDFSFEWFGEKGCNSGIKYRFQGYWDRGQLKPSPEGPERIEPVALEYQIADDEAHPDAVGDLKHSTASLYEYWPPEKSGPAKAGCGTPAGSSRAGCTSSTGSTGRRSLDLSLDAAGRAGVIPEEHAEGVVAGAGEAGAAVLAHRAPVSRRARALPESDHPAATRSVGSRRG